MKEGETLYYHYRSMVSHGDARKFIIGSIIFHFTLLALLLSWNYLMPSGSIIASLKGGGGLGSTIGVGLAGGLPEGNDYYKPPVRQLDTAVEHPTGAAAAKTKSQDTTKEKTELSRKNEFQVADKKTSKPASLVSGNQEDKKRLNQTKSKDTGPQVQTKSQTSTSSVVGTADNAVGVRGGSAVGGSGDAGTGLSVGIGGDENGTIDSWYARQVEQRIGSNWLKSRMGAQYSGQQRVVIQFEVTREGHIENIKIVETTRMEVFERTAFRAIQASDPLPQLPASYTIGKDRIRFMAVFEYPFH